MRIDKIIRGEKFPYYFDLIPNTMTVSVRAFISDETTICPISNDFKHIILPDSFKHFFTEVGYVKVGKLKLNKNQQHDAMDYNGIDWTKAKKQ